MKGERKKTINSAFLTLPEYKMLKRFTPDIKDIDKASRLGRKDFEKKTNMRIDLESPYLFYDIKNGKEPIFILNKPINVSVNDLKEVSVERLYKTSVRGAKIYYRYKGKKYVQKTRYDKSFDIYTRSGAPIYPYKTLKELKPRLKVRGLKRISKQLGMLGYIGKPFNLTYSERKVKSGYKGRK